MDRKLNSKKHRVQEAANMVIHHLKGTPIDAAEFRIGTDSTYTRLSNMCTLRRLTASVSDKTELVKAIDSLINEIET